MFKIFINAFIKVIVDTSQYFVVFGHSFEHFRVFLSFNFKIVFVSFCLFNYGLDQILPNLYPADFPKLLRQQKLLCEL